MRWIGLCVVAALASPAALALDPRKNLTQYSRRSWGQQDGLPQDTIRAIAQTTDGYLWLGTDEGLARFDGYDFTVFDKSNGDLPSNSITVLTAAPDGSLWIGTPGGLTQYRDRHFHTYTTRDGLPDNAVSSLYSDHAGTLWVAAGGSLSRFAEGKFHTFEPERALTETSWRVVREDPHHDLLAAGYGAVAKFAGDKTITLIDEATLGGSLVSALLVDGHSNLWVAGSLGLIERTASGVIRKFGQKEGLPDAFARAVLEDRDGNLWIGTNAGLARLEGDRFVTPAGGSAAATSNNDLVRCLFEDREGNLWVGANNGITRLRDDAFTVYGKPEGLPSDQPNAVFQDHTGRVWVSFHEGGLVFASPQSRRFIQLPGMPDTEVFSIRESPNGDLLMGTRSGLVRMHNGAFTTFVPPDPLSRRVVFDAIEDSGGTLWLASLAGLVAVKGPAVRTVIPSGPLPTSAMVTLCLGRDGVLWAGSGKGLWRVAGSDVRAFTTADGLSSDNIRASYLDSDGTLWIGTIGGGLNALREGHFYWFTQKDGLLSDNVSNIADDGESLWLSTTRGICRIAKRQLWDFARGAAARTAAPPSGSSGAPRPPTAAAGAIPRRLDPTNYGVEDGLRSAQCSPGYPTGGGGNRFADGRLWFATSRGLAVYDPREPRPSTIPPAIQLSEIDANGHALDLTRAARLSPGVGRIRIRYSAIHLSAPERVEYSYRLDGLEPDWVYAGARRENNYNSLKHGHYRFLIRANLAGGPFTEQDYSFDVLPHYYETAWFRLLCAALAAMLGWAAYQLRLRQIRYRFALVLGERARLAREIHDTLAQGFVGISSQLDAVAMCLPDEKSPVRKYLDLARRMARHSLTEARRSVMDLRASALEGQDLAAALESSTRIWTAGSPVKVDVDVSGPATVLPEEMEQHLLRIAQEAVTNVLKHAGASRVAIKLHTEARKLYLRIYDNGRGFEQNDAFVSAVGHFGLLGMRERAERLGGELRLASHPGEGTEVEVTVPLP